MIHAGFYTAIRSLSKDMKKVILELIREVEEKEKESSNETTTNIYLTGHSQRRCLATLYAIIIYQDNQLLNPEYVCTFGSARLGDNKF